MLDRETNGKKPDELVSAIRNDVANTHTIVSGVQNGVVDTHTGVSDIQHNALKSPEDIRGRGLMVSTTRTLPVTE